MQDSPSPSQPCPRCQYPMSSGSAICPNCGQVVAATASRSAKSGRASLAVRTTSASTSAPVAQSTLASYMGSHHDDADTVDQPLPPLPSLPKNPSALAASPPPPAKPGTPPKKPAAPPAPAKQASNNPFSVASVIIIIVLLGTIGFLLYLLNQSHPAATATPTATTSPLPALAVTSDYHVGTTPAGATGTMLQVEGQHFAPRATITFLLDSALAPDAPTMQSDDQGDVTQAVVVTANWALGTHALGARDDHGHTTKNSIPVVIVAAGEAMTPGPNNAPYDSQTFQILATVSPVDALSGAALPTYQVILTITGRPDPAGGTVCDPKHDSGQPVTQTGTANNVTFTVTSIFTCSGSYKSGQLMYTETTTSYQIVYANGVTCQATVPFINQAFSGSFTNATTVGGSYSADAVTYQCSNGQTSQSAPHNGAWGGTVTGG